MKWTNQSFHDSLPGGRVFIQILIVTNPSSPTCYFLLGQDWEILDLSPVLHARGCKTDLFPGLPHSGMRKLSSALCTLSVSIQDFSGWVYKQLSGYCDTFNIPN